MTLHQAIKTVAAGKGLCFRPTQLVGTGLEGCFTVRNGKVVPTLPPQAGILTSSWTVQTLDEYERELIERNTGV